MFIASMNAVQASNAMLSALDVVTAIAEKFANAETHDIGNAAIESLRNVARAMAE